MIYIYKTYKKDILITLHNIYYTHIYTHKISLLQGCNLVNNHCFKHFKSELSEKKNLNILCISRLIEVDLMS